MGCIYFETRRNFISSDSESDYPIIQRPLKIKREESSFSISAKYHVLLTSNFKPWYSSL